MTRALAGWNAGRLLGAALMAWYGFVCLTRPGDWHFLDNVTLIMHEAGHVVFSPFGWWLTIAGGSIFQVLVPLVFAVTFWRSGQRFAACVVALWVAASLFNLSVYVGDARARALPLLTDGNDPDRESHDWWQLLSALNMLRYDKTFSGFVWLGGAVWYVLSVMGAVYFARGDGAALPWSRQAAFGPDTPVAQLRNIGPRSARMLESVGVRTLGDLEDAGALEVCRRLAQAGQKPSLSLLYAVQGARAGVDWQALPQPTKDHLREMAEANGWLEKRVD